jgi:Cysteine-rich CWC
MNPTARIVADSRRVTCARCGSAFACGLGGDCWCAAEEFRLPLPVNSAADCLCPACLRAAAANSDAAPQA